MPLKVLLASDHYPPFIGGAHRQTQLLGYELTQRGHDVRIATVWQHGLPSVEDDNGVPVHRLKQLRTLGRRAGSKRQQHQPPFPDPVTVWQLRRLIKSFRPDVIHTYGWLSYSCAGALWGMKTPVLVTARDYAYSCPNRTMVYLKQELCSGPAVTKCLTCAGQHYGRPKGWISVAGVYVSRLLLKRKLTGIHNISTYVREINQRDFLNQKLGALDFRLDPRVDVVIPSFQALTADEQQSDALELGTYLRQLPDEPFILFVGALRLVKGLEQLFNAYSCLASPPPLVLIGTLERDSPLTFPTGVHIVRDVPHRAVMVAWERSLFGVLPSLWPEPLGGVVYEGMSRGKAIIGTRPGGHVDMIVHGETGFLVPAGDVDALREAMQRLIDDPGLRERFGKAGHERSERFTAACVVPQFEASYQRLLERSEHC